MNVLRTAEEIGLVQVGLNVAELLSSEELRNKVGAVMPLPSIKLKDNVEKMVAWIAELGKSKLMFLTPEIALFDIIPKYIADAEVIALVLCSMDDEVKGRLAENIPANVTVSLLNEPYFPDEFIPSNGVIVACGYMANGRLMVLPETYRLIEHYKDFYGKFVFLPYVKIDEFIKYEEWIEINPDKFNLIWRDAE